MDGSKPRESVARDSVVDASLARRRVLIVEDSPAFQAALSAMARALGGVETLVDTGAAGIAALDRGGFDLAIIDIGLPDMSGADVMAHVRGGDVALLAVSAHAEARDAPDADHFEAKPIARLADFNRAVTQAMARRDKRLAQGVGSA